MKCIELKEEETTRLPEADFNAEWMLEINRCFSRIFACEFPSPLNKHCFVIRPRDYVGIIQLNNELRIEIRPKIRCRLLMQMVECAYGMPAISAAASVGSMGDIFEFWAEFLAVQTLQRAKRGLYYDYREREGEESWLRGRLLVDSRAALASIKCRYAEHTADVLENRILASALHGLQRWQYRRAGVRRIVRAARRSLGGISHREVAAADCLAIRYHRLNQDYQDLHALCFSLLQQQSPAGEKGTELQPAYTLHMPTLFEQFCTEYVSANIAGKASVISQYHSRLKGGQGMAFRMDMALFAHDSGEAKAVIDAKYKMGGVPTEADVQQVVAYAVQLGVRKAFLLYPEARYAQRFDVGPVAVQAIGFDLAAADLMRAGSKVVRAITECV